VTHYLALEDVISIHEETMRRLGFEPQPLTRHENCISALDRPRWASHYEQADLIGQAARLGTGIARAHAFLDGNKRTAHRCLVIFLYSNGYRLPGDHLDLAKKLEALVHPDISDDAADTDLEQWLRDRVRPR
jgi:death on curing protein